ncbi:MAG: archease [Actinomycetota bacterium]
MNGYKILEHTADVGLRARAPDVTSLFEQATRGLCEIAGIWRDGSGTPVEIDVEARDHEGLVVDWLNEVLYVHDARTVAVCSVEVDEVSEGRARGRITVRPLGDGDETAIQVKAVTYHQLAVRETTTGWSATVFFDI